jgi:hypothetical protein
VTAESAEIETAVKGREAAEQAAHEQAFQARIEAQRRTVAEQLATETVEQMAAAEADARAQELATSLEEARAALLEQTKATLAAEQARSAAPPPAPPQPAAPRAAPAPRPPEPRIQPDGVPELVEFRSPSSSAVITVLLGIGALVAAGIAIYEAYLDQLTATPGIVASAVTLLLVIVVGRSKGPAGQVWLEQGVVHVDEGDSHRRFDLTTPNTKVEMVGQPGERRWKVLFLRKGMAPYEVTARLVDPEPFVDALRPWRHQLGS